MSRSSGITLGDALSGFSHNIINLFSSAAKREYKETERLYQQTREAFERSVCADTDALELAFEITDSALNLSGYEDAVSHLVPTDPVALFLRNLGC